MPDNTIRILTFWKKGNSIVDDFLDFFILWCGLVMVNHAVSMIGIFIIVQFFKQIRLSITCDFTYEVCQAGI